LTGIGEEGLEALPAKYIPDLITWMMPELVNEKAMKVEKWMELAFHLCKQRWDASIDWLEQQPMSKILLMTRIQSGFNEEQNRQAKRANK